MRISDWSSDVCSSDVARLRDAPVTAAELAEAKNEIRTSTIQNRETAAGKANVLAASVIIDGDPRAADKQLAAIAQVTAADIQRVRSAEHTSELQSLMRTSYAVFCVKKIKR